MTRARRRPGLGAGAVRLVALAILVVASLLTRAAEADAPARPIRLWHAYRGDEERALEQILATWKGAPVEVLALPYDALGSKLAAAIPLGEGPDVFIDAHERLGDFRARKIVGPVGDALEPGAFTPQATAAVTDDGIAWGVPLSQKCVALYVNDDLVRHTPSTLEGIAALAPTLPRGTFALAWENGVYVEASLFAAFGAHLLGSDDAFGLVGPGADAAARASRDLVDRGVVPEDADGSLVTNLFKSGRAAFAISGPWLAADLGAGKRPGGALRYHVEVLPRVEAAGGASMRPLLTVESAMLSPRGAARPEARALARLLASREAAETRMATARTVTARADLGEPRDELVRAFAAQARLADPMPSRVAMRATWEPANRALRKVLRHEADPAAAFEEARRRFDDVRQPLPPRQSPLPLLLIVGLLGLFAVVAALRRARTGGFAEVKRSLPAYAYVAHAVVVVGALVAAPLAVGAVTSLFAGHDETLRYVGLGNFVSILTARGGPLFASGSFYFVLAVTVLWTVVNVALHLAIGVALALALSRPMLRLRAVYRVLLIVPWAVPSYVTALAWKGMFHRQFGAVTGLILAGDRLFGLHVEPIAWFSRFSTAFAANVATNVWLGFPFMMVVTLGALTSVPDDVLEAAKVDGATRAQRFWLVTLPIIRPSLAPAVALGAIWTFNMFNVVFLVSGGDPDGTTDILVSEAYRWAFTREAQYGYAAAYGVLIFFLLLGPTRIAAHVRSQADKLTRETA